MKINEDKSDVWFRGMGGSVLGVWVAHGEGRFTVAEPRLLRLLEANGQVAMQYVDDDAVPTEIYPMNPNGSPGTTIFFKMIFMALNHSVISRRPQFQIATYFKIFFCIFFPLLSNYKDRICYG